MCLFELCPYGIWNTSTPPLPLKEVKFELCPYGIWNRQTKTFRFFSFYLNFVPMGFETTLSQRGNKLIIDIWTLSLWDLKQICVSSCNTSIIFELCPYGIWNSHYLYFGCKFYIIWTLSLWDLKPQKRQRISMLWTHLNFVPMGFETNC